MIPLHRRQLAYLLTVAIITCTVSGFACGSSSVIKSFRVALASSGPLVNSLASSGVIPQAKVSVIIADFDAAAQCGLILQEMFSAIPKDLPANEIRSRKLNASVNALRCFRTIVQRQNFGSNPRIQQVADIADGILASLVVFYSEPGEMRASTIENSPNAASATAARDEKELEAQLKARVEALERAMKP